MEDILMKEMWKTNCVFAVSEHSHADYDCFACAILTHGCENDALYARDGPMVLSELVDRVASCKTLSSKPKLFFVQVQCSFVWFL